MTAKSPRNSSILLVNPWIHDFAAFDFWAKPLGLLMIGAMLRERGGAVNLVDCMDVSHPAMISAGLLPRKRAGSGAGNFFRLHSAKPAVLAAIDRPYFRYGMHPDIFLDVLDKIERPDTIFVTCGMTYWYLGAFEAIEILQAKFPGAPIILGGVYPTLCGEHAQRNSGATFVMQGPFEKYSPAILGAFAGSWGLGVAPFANWAKGPRPCLDLYPALEHAPIMTSRGCPFQCSYCGVRRLCPAYEKRSVESVLDEIQYWYADKGVRNFAIYDDAIMADMEGHLIPLLEGIARLGLPLKFHAASGLHLRGIDKEVGRLLRLAGFATIRLGLETHLDESRPSGDRKAKADETASAVNALKEAGYDSREIGIYLLVGLPGQDVSQVEDAVDFALALGARPHLAEYSPIPGSAMWDQAVATSRFDLTAEPLFHNNSLFPCVPEEKDRLRIVALRNRLRELFRPRKRGRQE